MDNHNLEQRTDDLEKRVAALEEKVQAQSTVINLNIQLQDSYFVEYLIQCISNYQKKITKSESINFI